MAAAEQLCVIDFIQPQAPDRREPGLVDAMLVAHGGDYRRAMAELMADADFLRDQLYTASQLMSKGYGRGWRPRYERV
jgi:hypothetical protein